MTSLLTETAVARPFVPAKDFELSKRFYARVGFQLLLDGEVAIFGIGQTSFILQNYFNKGWAENFMMQLMVDDVDAWWTHLKSLDLNRDFPTTSLRPPEVQPLGAQSLLLGGSDWCLVACGATPPWRVPRQVATSESCELRARQR